MREFTEREYRHYRVLKFAAVLRMNERMMLSRFETRHDGSGRFARSARLRRQMKRKIVTEALKYADALAAEEMKS